MKRLILLTTVLFFVSSNSFAQTNWGAWKTTDCLEHLEFRVKLGEFNKYAKKYYWYIEFRNRYSEKIHFNYEIVPPSMVSEIKKSGKTTSRINLESGATESTYSLVKSLSVYVFVNRIKFGDNDKYSDCDK